MLEDVQCHADCENEHEFVAGVEEEVAQRVVVLDAVWRLETRVQQTQPHGEQRCVLPATHRPVLPVRQIVIQQ